jgi:hypothetical protein
VNIPRHNAQQAGTRIAVINHTSFVIIKTDWQLEENINYFPGFVDVYLSLSYVFILLKSSSVERMFAKPVSD